ncbi:MAG: hypothetical protein GZ086_13655, partial [Gelidibacter sp.]|nr:hypothetical protein [Gelidibacter sp.]
MQKKYPQFNSFCFFIFLFFTVNSFSQQSQIFSIPGTSTFTVPAGVTTIKVEAWGSGAAGHNTNNRGGGGGAFAGINAITVTPGSTYTVTVGAGAASGSGGNGQNSSFGTLVIAAGAIGGNGGAVASSTGTIRYAGGNGGSSNKNGGAGGGGSAGAGGTGDVGGNTSDNTGGTAGGAGIAGSGSAGAAGGVGGNNNTTGSSGTFPGGGGGEGGEGYASGGGGNGQVKISWITVSASSPTAICSGTSTNLTSSALPINPRGVLLNEGFNNPTNNWTLVNNSTGGTPTNAAWTLSPNNYVITIPKNGVWDYVIKCNSNDASQFYLSNSDSQGAAGTTQTILQSPVMSTVGYSSLSLDFYHYYQHYTGSSANVEVSTNGTTWTSLATYSTTLGSSSAFAHTTITLGATYLGVSSLYIRFKYDAPWGYWWAIDNVTVSGTRTNYDYSWSASPPGTAGLSAGAGTPSSFNASITVNPTATTIYTVTAASGDGLIGQISTTVTVNPTSVGGTASSNQTICKNSSPANITLVGNTGTIQWQSSTDNSTFNNIAGATTSTLSSVQMGGALSTTRYYRALVTSGVCTLAYSNVVTVTVSTVNRWTGTVSSDWNNPANWTCGVPSVTNDMDAVVPSGLVAAGRPYPILNLGLEGYAKNIVFENGSTLNVIANSLKVTGTLTLNGKIDLEGESQLVQTNGSVFDPASTGTIEIDQQGTSDNFRYNYWGSPVNSIGGTSYTIAGVLRDGTFPNSSFFSVDKKTINFGAAFTYADNKLAPIDDLSTRIKSSTYWMYKFVNSADDYAGWKAVGSDGNLKAGEGFTLKGSNTTLTAQNYTFVGKPNNGDIKLTITAGRQYLIGNPYPSAIDAKQFIKDNISIADGGTVNVIDGNLYFWDHFGGGTHYLKSYEGGYSIYNLSAGTAGGTRAVSTDARIKVTTNSSNKASLGFIPVAQGFFVTALAGGDIQFKNSQRIFKKENAIVSQFLKSAGKVKSSKETAEAEDVFPRIYLNYSSPKGF